MKELARKAFVSLVKDKAIVFGRSVDAYYILKDGTFEDRIYADNDAEAVVQFNKRYEGA